MLLLINQTFSFINAIELTIIALTFFVNVTAMISGKINYERISKYLNIMITTVGLMTVFRYIYDFTKLQLPCSYLKEFSFYLLITDHRGIIGFDQRQKFF